LDRYARLEWQGEQRPAGYVEASRGCKHLCRHCPIPPVYGGRFFAVPQDVLLEDIRRQVEAGARHVTFGDPDFLNGPTHALRVARAVHAAFPQLTFDLTTKVEHILKHRDLFPKLGELGGLFVVSAVESLNDTVLQHLDKGHTRADGEEALRAVRAAGMTLRPSLVPFTPWETLESYLDLFDWAAREDLIGCIDPVQYTIRLLVPPGSLLLDSPAMQPHLGTLDQASFSYRWAHPDPRMDRLQSEAAALVEAADRDREDPRVTFHRVWELALRAQGGAASPPRHLATPRVPPSAFHLPPSRPPRLTESWSHGSAERSRRRASSALYRTRGNRIP
jgi:hypothetical protein